MKKTLFGLIIIMLVFSFVNAAAYDAIDFTAKDTNGKKISLHGFKDTLVLLDFWATWCPPCRKEIPNLIDIKNTFKSDKFEILSIALERGSFDPAKVFVKEHKMNWVHIIDAAAAEKIAKSYRIQAIPTMYLVKNGKIVATGLRGHGLKGKIKKLLGK
ncbi:MAG: TlpA family protein disulfide reductase [bacterium]|nr:TlpA family protein disulfide reductase [bacterium]